MADARKIIYEVSGKDECEPVLEHFGFKITHVFDFGGFICKVAVRR